MRWRAEVGERKSEVGFLCVAHSNDKKRVSH